MIEAIQSQNLKISGAEIFIKCLEKEGVEHIFGLPGGVILPIYDILFQKENITHILTKHEQAAVHAAEGYAKSSGKVGVVLVTSGPGATNTVTGLADAYYDSIPIVVFTGNVHSSELGTDAFQETDIISITRACTKFNYQVRDIKELAKTIKDAFYIASTGRPGPVLIDLPKDIITSKCNFEYPEEISISSYNSSFQPDTKAIKRIFEEIQKAQKPLILCGGGVVSSNSSTKLTLFSEKYNIPVVSTLKGLGGFPAKHKNFFGFSGMHGHYCANLAVSNCDLLIIFGSRLSDRQIGLIHQYSPNAKIVHIDIDSTSINKNIDANLSIIGDIKDVLIAMLGYSEENISISQYYSWHNEINNYKIEEIKEELALENRQKLSAREVIRKVYEHSEDDAIITTEVGQHQMWAAQLYDKNHEGTFITSGGLGTMGFGFPAGLGAKFANPNRKVITIAGDGSIQMNIQELATAITYNIPIKIVIINNGFLGMVKQIQNLLFEKRYSETKIISPDYLILAEAYGIKGFRIKERGELDKTMKEALSCTGSVIIDCVVNDQEDVYPWVTTGRANKDMLTEAG